MILFAGKAANGENHLLLWKNAKALPQFAGPASHTGSPFWIDGVMHNGDSISRDPAFAKLFAKCVARGDHPSGSA